MPWNWRFPLLYLVAAFVLRLVVRTENDDLNLVGLGVVLGASCVFSRWYAAFGMPTRRMMTFSCGYF